MSAHPQARLPALDTSPTGDENAPNPLALDWRANDGAGVGTDGASLRYTVQAPSGATFGPFPLTATVDGNDHNATSTLRRNGVHAIPPLGQVGQTQEGDFTITFSAADRLGNTGSLARCWRHQPIGAPVQRTVSGAIPAGTLAEDVHALSIFRLEGDRPISALLNATHAGAGLMRVESW
ncbi:MAG: hypothetical protein HS111_28785 [Kofleriaceae bacterium]|nr:hypothetical protein [Kofleriaceae bacterium]